MSEIGGCLVELGQGPTLAGGYMRLPLLFREERVGDPFALILGCLRIQPAGGRGPAPVERHI